MEESKWTHGVLSKRVLYCQLKTLRPKVQWSARLEVLPGSLLKSGQSEVLKSIICHDKDRTRTPVERPEVKPNRNLIAGGVDVSPDIRYLDIAVIQNLIYSRNCCLENIEKLDVVHKYTSENPCEKSHAKTINRTSKFHKYSFQFP